MSGSFGCWRHRKRVVPGVVVSQDGLARGEQKSWATVEVLSVRHSRPGLSRAGESLKGARLIGKLAESTYADTRIAMVGTDQPEAAVGGRNDLAKVYIE